MLEVIKSLRDLDDLMHEWNLLPGAQQNPLLRHEWFLSAAEAFHNKHDLRVITLRESGRLRAVAPLALVKRHGIQRLELLGASALHEPSDVLYDGADSLLELCAVIARLPQATVLQRVMESSLLMDQLMQRSQGHGKLLKLSATPAPFIDIQAPWERYFNSLSSRRRYDFRHARAKLERSGKVSVEFIVPTEADLERHMQEALRIESSGWKGRAGSALKFNLPLQRFMHAYAQRSCRLGMLQLSYLKCNNESIAMQIGILHADRHWVLKIGYDERWAFCSPGVQLTMEAVKKAFDSGLKTYEFLGADESWLRIWTQHQHPSSTLLYYPYTTRGLSALGTDTLSYLAKRTVQPMLGMLVRK